MEEKDYIVIRIEGEYAYLRDLADPLSEDLFIALALLPIGIDIGTRLHYAFPDYTVIE